MTLASACTRRGSVWRNSHCSVLAVAPRCAITTTPVHQGRERGGRGEGGIQELFLNRLSLCCLTPPACSRLSLPLSRSVRTRTHYVCTRTRTHTHKSHSRLLKIKNYPSPSFASCAALSLRLPPPPLLHLPPSVLLFLLLSSHMYFARVGDSLSLDPPPPLTLPPSITRTYVSASACLCNGKRCRDVLSRRALALSISPTLLSSPPLCFFVILRPLCIFLDAAIMC